MGTPKKVFLSYARADRDRARKLAEHLREAGLEVWDPEQELLPGSDFTSDLKEALDTAEAVVVLISPDAMESRSVSHEIEYALGAKHLRGRLIPVLIRPTKEIPWILNTLHMIRYEHPGKTSQHIAELLTQPQDAPPTKLRQANWSVPVSRQQESRLCESPVEGVRNTRSADIFQQEEYPRRSRVARWNWAALKRCDWFLVVLSPQSVASKWVKHELIYALQANRYKGRIVPILYKACDADKLSWTLFQFQRIDFRKDFHQGYWDLLSIWNMTYSP